MFTDSMPQQINVPCKARSKKTSDFDDSSRKDAKNGTRRSDRIVALGDGYILMSEESLYSQAGLQCRFGGLDSALIIALMVSYGHSLRRTFQKPSVSQGTTMTSTKVSVTKLVNLFVCCNFS